MIVEKARAKVNFTLDVLGKRPDGYHEVEMILQSISLYDTVVIENKCSQIQIVTDSREIPKDKSNLAYIAAEKFMDFYGISSGVKISIIKRIPVAAGLAGGSSNAAAVLRGLARLFNIKANLKELTKIGEEIGSDVPFCIQGGCAVATGRGEVITPVIHNAEFNILLAKPTFGVSTATTYKSLNLDVGLVKKSTKTKDLLSALYSNDITSFAKGIYNDLEKVTIKNYPEIELIKKDILDSGALGVLMSGSGPTVYGIFEKKEKLIEGYNYILTRNIMAFSVGLSNQREWDI